MSNIDRLAIMTGIAMEIRSRAELITKSMDAYLQAADALFAESVMSSRSDEINVGVDEQSLGMMTKSVADLGNRLGVFAAKCREAAADAEKRRKTAEDERRIVYPPR